MTNLVESFACHSCNEAPTATPHCSGIPINLIAPCLEANDSLAQLRCKEAYQSFIGSIGWLLSTTRPAITAAHSFLSLYTNKPASVHMKAALYILHYIHSTHDYGISASHSFQIIEPLCTCTFTFLHPQTQRHTTTPLLPNWDLPTPFQLIAMLVGVPSLESRLPMALFSLIQVL